MRKPDQAEGLKLLGGQKLGLVRADECFQARADFLVTKDQALLKLSRRSVPFRIVTPDGAA